MAFAEDRSRLVEVQQHTENRVGEPSHSHSQFTQVMRRITETQNGTAASFVELAHQMGLLGAYQEQSSGRIDRLLEGALENRYRNHCAGYFGGWLKRPRVVPDDELDDAAEERLTPEERCDALLVDLVLRGRLRPPLGQDVVALALEVAAVVDEGDVERAIRRAGLLRRALGQPVVPAVGGESVLLEAEQRARQESVAVLQDGRRFLWDEAVQRWTVPS